jgi:hypothetical protein
MANYDEVYGSGGKHLKAEDLKDRTHKLTIVGVDIATFKEGKKLVLNFKGKEKGLVLNKTNAKIVAKYYGPDYDKWGGNEIEIFPTETEFNGQLVPCIRVRVEKPVAAAADGFMDDIPF